MSDSRFVTLRPHALARAALVCASALAAAAWAQSPAQQDFSRAQKSAPAAPAAQPAAPAAAQDLPLVRITDTAAPVDAESPSAAHLRAGT